MTFLNVSAVFDIVTSMLIVLAALLGGPWHPLGPGPRRVHHRAPRQPHRAPAWAAPTPSAIRLLLFGGLLGLVVLFPAPRPAPHRVGVEKPTAQSRSKQQPDPERLRLTSPGTISPEDGHPQDPARPSHLLDDDRRGGNPGCRSPPIPPTSPSPSPAPSPGGARPCPGHWPGCAPSTTWTSISPRPVSPA